MDYFTEPTRFGSVDQRRQHLVVGDGWHGHVLVAAGRPLVFGRTSRDDHVPDLDARLERAGGADPQEGVDADGGQFLDGDGRGRTPDARRADRQRSPLVSGVDDLVLAVLCDRLVVLAVARDAVDPTGVARNDRHVVYVALLN